MAQIVTTCCEDPRAGAVLFVSELARCSAALEHFNPEVAYAPRTEQILDASHALFEEFLYLAEPYFNSHPDVMAFLKFIAQHNTVIAMLPACYENPAHGLSRVAQKQRIQNLEVAAIQAYEAYIAGQ